MRRVTAATRLKLRFPAQSLASELRMRNVDGVMSTETQVSQAYIYIYMYICVYIYMYMYHIYIYMSISLSLHVYIRIHMLYLTHIRNIAYYNST